MDVLELIKADHCLVESLFSEIENAEDTHKLYDSFNQLYEALNVHTEVEEQVFYPAIRNSIDIENLVDAAQKEHNEAKQMLEDVSSLSPTSAEFKAKIRELKQAIQHHIQEEENEVFSQVLQCMSQEERSQLGSEFEVVKSKLQTEISVAT
jgi:iron-sulfur cluster repair protein YtfE (RIC family)